MHSIEQPQEGQAMEKVILDGSSGQLMHNRDVVLVRYPEGDCDTFDWPLDTAYRPREKQLEQIAEAMSDARECGDIPVSCKSVFLPDGTEIELL
jgi:hypothetical protein